MPSILPCINSETETSTAIKQCFRDNMFLVEIVLPLVTGLKVCSVNDTAHYSENVSVNCFI